MKQKNKWLKNYPMMDYEKADYKKIKNSVREKLSEQKSEVIYMKHKKIKSVAIAGAALAVSAASFFTVNAATDGAVVDTVKEWFQNVTVRINGEDVELPAKVKEVKTDGDKYTEYEFEIDDDEFDGENNEFIFEFSEDGNDLNMKVVEETETSNNSKN